MDFELKALSPVQASQLAVDALVVLVPDDTQGMDGADALSELVRDASRTGDLETGVGKCLSVYRPQGLKPVRVVLARTGDCSPAAVRKAVTAALGERDKDAAICLDEDGHPEPDSELRDTENVPLSESIAAFFEREVRPHVPDAWIDMGVRDAKDAAR